MKKYFALILSFVICIALATSSFAQGYALPEGHTVTATSVYFFNVDTGDVVLDVNSTQERDIASLTKMMTCLLLIENVQDLDGTIITAPSEAYVYPVTGSSSSTADIYPNEEVSALTLLYAMLLPSGNEAAQIVAHYLGNGDPANFYTMMNARAQELGCVNTNFTNAHGLEGLEAGNYSSAKDLALIAQACWQYDIFREVAGTESYGMPVSNIHTYVENSEIPDVSYTIYNTNNMIRDTSAVYRDYIKGIKTGSTYNAGRTLATAAVNDRGETYIGVVLGAPYEAAPDGNAYSFHDTAYIYDWIFENFSVQNPINKNAPITEIDVELSSEIDSMQLLPARDFNIVLPIEGQDYANGRDDIIEQIQKDALAAQQAAQAAQEEAGTANDEESEEQESTTILPDTLMYEFNVPDFVEAPIAKGDIVGTMTVKMNGEVLDEVELVASQDVSRNFVLFIVDWVSGFFDSLYFRIVIGLTLLYILVLVVIVKLMQTKYVGKLTPKQLAKKKKREEKRRQRKLKRGKIKDTAEVDDTKLNTEEFSEDEWDSVRLENTKGEDWTNFVEVDRIPPNARKGFFNSKQDSKQNKNNKSDK